EEVSLLESWRSAPEILTFVDTVFTGAETLAGLRPAQSEALVGFPLKHIARRRPLGCLELWPIEITEPAVDVDPWQPVDAEPPLSANKKLAKRIAISVKAMVARGAAVGVRGSPPAEN